MILVLFLIETLGPMYFRKWFADFRLWLPTFVNHNDGNRIFQRESEFETN